MTLEELAPIAHRGLLLRPSSLLRTQRGGRHEMREGVALFSWGMSGPSFNKAVALGPTPSLDRILELAVAFFGNAQAGFGVLVHADTGHPVEAELRARGWAIVEDEPALVMPTIPSAPPAVSSARIRVFAAAIMPPASIWGVMRITVTPVSPRPS